MTKFQEFPLRPQGQAWPGLNTRGGILDPGSGFLEDGSVNAIINEADLLEKRKGLVRGLDERFEGVVCGLFRYTDECGIEYIVVADQESIKPRTPFSIPEFLGTDSIPTDDFLTLSDSLWSGTENYHAVLGALQLRDTVPLRTTDFVPATEFLTWFKAAALTSYFVEIQYRFANMGKEVASVIIKRSGSNYLIASVVSDGAVYKVVLDFVFGGVRTTLSTVSIGDLALRDGFLRLSYEVQVGAFVATARVIPSGSGQASASGNLNENQAVVLGQGSAVALSRSTSGGLPEIESVSGGRV